MYPSSGEIRSRTRCRAERRGANIVADNCNECLLMPGKDKPSRGALCKIASSACCLVPETRSCADGLQMETSGKPYSLKGLEDRPSATVRYLIGAQVKEHSRHAKITPQLHLWTLTTNTAARKCFCLMLKMAPKSQPAAVQMPAPSFGQERAQSCRRGERILRWSIQETQKQGRAVPPNGHEATNR